MENLSPFMLVLILGCLNWLATSLGGTVVFANTKKIHSLGYSNILAISAGIMLSASFWSLLLPSVDISRENGQTPSIVTCIGFLFGVLFLYNISKYAHRIFKIFQFNNTGNTLLITAISLHNIPEGFIVGVLVSGLTTGNENIDILAVITLSLSIGLQNIPEGLAIALPLVSSGQNRLKSFNIVQLTGFIEPISAIFGYLFVSQFPKLLPYSLSFAGGAMIYVIINELVPEFTYDKSKTSIIWFSVGFIIMMGLDTILSSL